MEVDDVVSDVVNDVVNDVVRAGEISNTCAAISIPPEQVEFINGSSNLEISSPEINLKDNFANKKHITLQVDKQWDRRLGSR